MSPHFVQKVIACWEQQGERANGTSSPEEGVTHRRRKKICRAAGRMVGNGSHEDATAMPAARSKWNLQSATLLAALAGLLIGSCTEKPETGPSKATPAPTPTSLVQPVHPQAMPPARPRPRPSQLKTAKKGPRIDPIILVGLDPPAVGRMLGRPAATRTDAMAMEWSYSTPNCSLNIFFYPDVATGNLRALKYNIAGKQPKRGCPDFPVVARNEDDLGEER
jgi:hypothetical protein